jgi:hypothetical protein
VSSTLLPHRTAKPSRPPILRHGIGADTPQ